MSIILFIILSIVLFQLSYIIVHYLYLLLDFIIIIFDFVIITFDFISLFVMSALNLICILMLFLISNVSDAFYFNEVNIMFFLDYFKLLDENYYINDSNLIKKLSDYYEFKI